MLTPPARHLVATTRILAATGNSPAAAIGYLPARTPHLLQPHDRQTIPLFRRGFCPDLTIPR